MGIHLGESLHCLPVEEIRRLQRVLRVILNHPARENARRLIRTAFDRLGLPFDFLAAAADEARLAFERLLGGFGRLSTSQMTEGERAALQRSPFTLWPAPELCTVPAEVFQRLSQDIRVRRRGYLFAHIHNLSPRERRGWARWLSLSEARNDRERQMMLYREVARLQQEQSPDAAAEFRGQRLEEYFTDNPLVHPIAWYHRGVLGLYDSLSETQTRLSPGDGERIGRLLLLLKSGRLVVREEQGGFGERVRLRLHETLERPLPLAAAPSVTLPVLEHRPPAREQLLF